MGKDQGNALSEADAVPPQSPADAVRAAEREELLLEKLRLDNREQEARIAQLQLEWWQKPKALVVMLIPLVPILVTAVTAISGRLAEADKLAAATQKKAAENEMRDAQIKAAAAANDMRMNELEGKRLELKNAELKAEQARLTRAKADLAAGIESLRKSERKLIDAVFQRYTDVCEIAGQIATAPTPDAADEQYRKFADFDLLSLDAAIAEPIAAIEQTLKEWRASNSRPDDELRRVALDLSLACKAAFARRNTGQFVRPIRELTLQIYQEAQQLIGELRAAADPAATSALVNRFWQLYYGKLVLVESREVAGGMVTAGDVLKKWKADSPERPSVDQLRSALDALQRVFGEARQKLEAELAREPDPTAADGPVDASQS